MSHVQLRSRGREFKATQRWPGSTGNIPTVVLCPGRVGGITTVAWLIEPLLSKGLGALAIEYSGPEERCFPRDVEDVEDPVLFVRGTNDLIAPIDHSWWMVKAMRDAGRQDVSLIEIEDAGHFFERRLEG